MTGIVVLTALSSIFFGASDFFSGWSVRRLNVIKATTIAYAAGGVLIVAALVFGGWISSLGAWFAGTVSGIVALIGFVTGYAAMSLGPMSLLSPAAALIEAIIPITIACLTGHLLGPVAWFAIALGLTAIVLIAMEPKERGARVTAKAGLLAAVSGISLGASVVALNFSPPNSGLIPAVAEAITGLILLASLAIVGRWMHRTRGWLFGTPDLPNRPQASVSDVALSASTRVDEVALDEPEEPIPTERAARILSVVGGILLGAGNIVLLLALHSGHLAVVAVIASLYPLGTIGLAAWILKERIEPRQATGIGLAIAATVMLTMS
jgi:drug/metabolite transporter (DMT)-like permease